jgi:hypothetical protein
MVDATVAASAMMRLFAAAVASLESENAAEYQAREKPCQIVNRDELKLKTASTSSGRCRNAYAPAAYRVNQRLTTIAL